MADMEKFDDFDFDDGLDIPEFNDFGIDDVGKKRNPVIRAGKGLLKGAGSAMLTENVQRNLIRNTLPEGYAKAHGDLHEASRFVGGLYDTASRQLAPAKQQAKRLLRGASKRAEGVLPSWLSKKLNDWTEPEDESRLPTKDDYDNEKISTTLAGIFEAQERSQAERDELLRKQREISDTEDDVKFKVTDGRLVNVESALSRLVSYQDSVTASFQRESLKLQFRQYFAQRDSLILMQAFTKDAISELKGITLNTALPDFVKQQKSEEFKRQIRDRTIGVATDSLAGFGSSFMSSMQSRITDAISRSTGSLRDYIHQASDAVSMSDMLDGVDKVELGGSVVGGLGAEILSNESGNLLGKLASSRVGRMFGVDRLLRSTQSDKAKILGSRLEMLSDNKRQAFENMLYNAQRRADDRLYENDSLFNRLISDGLTSLSTSIPRYNPYASFGGDSATMAMEQAAYDATTDRTIVEVIPRLLSEILRETEAIRTGQGDVERQVFSYERGGLVRESTLSKDIVERMLPTSAMSSIRDNVDDIVKVIDKDNVLSNDARAALRRQLLMDISTDATFNVSRYAEPGALGYIKDPSLSEEVQSVLIDRFLDESGKIKRDSVEANESIATVSRLFNRSKDQLPAYNQTMRGLMQTYGRSSLVDSGMLEASDLRGGFRTNVDNVMRHVVDGKSRAVYGRVEEEFAQHRRSMDNVNDNNATVGEEVVANNKPTSLNNVKLTGLESRVSKTNNILTDIYKLLLERLLGPDHPTESHDVPKPSPDKPKGPSLSQRLRSGGTALGSNIKSRYQSLADTVKRHSEPTYRTIKDKTSSVYVDLKDSLSQHATKAQSYLGSKYKETAELTARQYVELKDDVQKRWGDLSESERDYWAEILSKRPSMDDVKDKLNSAKETLAGQANDLNSRRKSATSDAVEGVKAFFSDLYNKMSPTSQRSNTLLSNDEEPMTTRQWVNEIKGHLDDMTSRLIEAIYASGDKIPLDGYPGSELHKLTRNKRRLFRTAAGSIAGAAGRLVRGTANLYGGALSGAGSIFKGVGSRIGSLFSGSDSTKIKDIYLKGVKDPILTARDMVRGKYFDQDTGEAIRSLSDIKGTIVDESGNIVITTQEITDGKLTTLDGKPGFMDRLGGLAKSAAGGVMAGAKGILDLYTGGAKFIFAGTSSLLSKSQNVLFGDKVTDVYVRGEDTPRLRAILLKRGYYYDQTTGNPITSFNDIIGPVVDKDNNIIISNEDLAAGLVTRKGEKIGVLGKAMSLGAKALGAVGSFYKGMWDVGSGLIKSIFGRKDKSEKGDVKGELLDVNRQQLDVLSQIHQVLYDTYVGDKERHDKSGDGFRDGSWQSRLYGGDKQTLGAGAEATPMADRSGERRYSADGSIFGSIANAGSSIANRAMDMGAGALAAGGAVAGRGGILRRSGRAAIRGGGALLRGGGRLASWVGRGALMASPVIAKGAVAVGTGIASVVSAPVVIGAAAVAATAVGGYLLYRHLTRDTLGELTKLRYVQYGANLDNNVHIQKLTALERYLEEYTSIDSNGQPQFSSGLDPEKLLDVVGISSNDEQNLEVFKEWLQHRFKPVFFTHMVAASKLAPNTELKDLDSKLSKLEKYEYINLVDITGRVGLDVFGYQRSPFDNTRLSGFPEVASIFNATKAEFTTTNNETGRSSSRTTMINGEVVEHVTNDGSVDTYHVSRDVDNSPSNMHSVVNQLAQDRSILRNDNIQILIEAPLQLSSIDSLSVVVKAKLITYGLADKDVNSVNALLTLESYVKDNVSISGRGSSNYSGNTRNIYERTATMFNRDPSNGNDYANWRNWFINRFLPVYITYRSSLQRLGVQSERSLTTDQQRDVISSVMNTMNDDQVTVWTMNTSPWSNVELNGTIEMVLQLLDSIQQSGRTTNNTWVDSSDVDRQLPNYTTPDVYMDVGDEEAERIVRHERERTRVQAARLDVQQQRVQSRQLQDAHRMVNILKDSYQVQRDMHSELKKLNATIERKYMMVERDDSVEPQNNEPTTPSRRTQGPSRTVEPPVNFNR